MTNIYSINLLDLIPSNLKQDRFIEALAIVLSEELNDISNDIPLLLLMKNIHLQKEEVVDMLAWQQHVDYYDPTLTLEQKREIVAKSDFFHRYKGTSAAVEQLVNTVFGDGVVQEWYEYGGMPGYFKVITSNWTVTNENAETFTKALASVKRETSRLEKVELSASDELPLYFGGVVHIGENMKVRQVV